MKHTISTLPVILLILTVASIISCEKDELVEDHQDQSTYLFTKSENTSEPETKLPSFVADYQNIYFNSNHLKENKDLKIKIFDQDFIVRLHARKINNEAINWKGSIVGVNNSMVVFSIVDNIISGSIFLNGNLYQIKSVGEHIHQIQKINQSMLPEEAEPIPVEATIKNSTTRKVEASCSSDSPEKIDILVFYTRNARDASGGTSSIKSEINLAIQWTNLSYEYSDVLQRVHLVDAIETSYTEVGEDFLDDLDWLHTNSTVKSKRDDLKADIVVLIVEGGEYCGRGFDIMNRISTDFASKAFCVVARDCATQNYTFMHETGHLMGCRHECGSDSNTATTNTASYDYAHGYYSCNGGWRTIMAYPQSECDVFKVPHWSNPDIDYNGIPMGGGPSDGKPPVLCQSNNARVLNNTAPVVANFRCSGEFTGDNKWSGYGVKGGEGWYVGDFNGDGKDDIMRYYNSNGGADVCLSKGNSFGNVKKWSGYGTKGGKGWYVGDFNGDGKDDILRFINENGGADVCLSNGSSFGTVQQWSGYGVKGGEGWYVGDFNGDGKDDIMRYYNSNGGADVCLSKGNSFGNVKKWSGYGTKGGKGWYVGDFNGDGKDDILRFINENGGADVCLSNGSSFGTVQQWSGYGTKGGEGWYVGDFNGDGKDDIMRYLYPEDGGADVFLSTGSSFKSPKTWSIQLQQGGHGWYVGDYDEDGNFDVLRYLNSNGGAEVYLSDKKRFK